MSAGRGEAPARRVRRTGPAAALWIGIAVLLLPLAAMRVTQEVNWSPFDSAVAAMLLGGAGLIYETAVRRIEDPTRRLIAAAALVAAVAIAWAQGAVGIL